MGGRTEVAEGITRLVGLTRMSSKRLCPVQTGPAQIAQDRNLAASPVRSTIAVAATASVASEQNYIPATPVPLTPVRTSLAPVSVTPAMHPGIQSPVAASPVVLAARKVQSPV